MGLVELAAPTVWNIEGKFWGVKIVNSMVCGGNVDWGWVLWGSAWSWDVLAAS
jgi:hypothetical protein